MSGQHYSMAIKYKSIKNSQLLPYWVKFVHNFDPVYFARKFVAFHKKHKMFTTSPMKLEFPIFVYFSVIFFYLDFYCSVALVVYFDLSFSAKLS